MQQVSTPFQNTFDQDLSIKSDAKVLAEWNFNIFDTPTVTPNAGDFGEDDDLFPIDSITNAHRPIAGMPKARVGRTRTAKRGNYSNRAYLVDKDSKYKYWSSGNISAVSISGGSYPLSSVDLSVTYAGTPRSNKICVTFENTWASPVNYTIQITTNGTVWTTVATNPAIDQYGQVILYRQANGTWSATANYTSPINIAGIRLVVTSLNKASSHLELIEFALKLEEDVSSDLITYSVDKQMTEVDLVLPVGKISTDSANVSLDNSTGKYNNLNVSSIYHNIIEENVRFTLFAGIDTTPHGGTGFEYVKLGTYYADSWGSQGTPTVSVSCTDITKFFQTDPAPNWLFVGRDPAEIISNALGVLGWNKFVVELAPNENYKSIPYAWWQTETTLWEIIQNVCQATQSIIYVDEDEWVHFKSRDMLFTDGPDTRVLSNRLVGSKQPDIISLTEDFTVQTNSVKIKYKPTHPSRDRLLQPTTDTLWQPTDTIALNSAYITKDISATETNVISIERFASRTFPFVGRIAVQGEIIDYNGKTYKYHDATTHQAVYAVCKSQADKDHFDIISDPNTLYANDFVGELRNLTRGQEGTTATAHYVSYVKSGWTCSKFSTMTNSGKTYSANSRMKSLASSLILSGEGKYNYHEIYTAKHGTANDDWDVVGTRVYFPKVNVKDFAAGLFFNMQADDMSAYYVEIKTSDYASSFINAHEVRIFKGGSNGNIHVLPDATMSAGWPITIVKGTWVDIDVIIDKPNNQFTVFINGSPIANFWVPSSDIESNTPVGTPPMITISELDWANGKAGVFVRGSTIAAFEYFYAVRDMYKGRGYSLNLNRIIHKILGGWHRAWFLREIFFMWRWLRKRKHQGHSGSLFNPFPVWYFDDFGPYAHEVRKFDVTFDKFPALNSDLYISNDIYAHIVEYNSTPFGATFWIANQRRDELGPLVNIGGPVSDPAAPRIFQGYTGTAILNGEDTEFISGQSVNQAMQIYGTYVVQDEEQTEVVQNTAQIKRAGLVEIELASDLIQSKEAAQDIGTFITNNWGESLDTVTVECWIHPAQELTDLVSIDFNEQGYFQGQNRYHVVGISLSYDAGIKGSLTLRRVRV